jgi:dolichol-phosphate mannosyltransferase
MNSQLVIIPAYNEEKLIGSVLKSAIGAGPWDVLVVEDGSTDRTFETVRSCAGIEVIRHEKQLGYGRSLIDGFRYAAERGYEVVVTMDGDQQHETEFLQQFFLEAGSADIVSGSRYLPSSPVRSNAPEERRRLNATITDYLRLLTGFSITDAFCGFKAYRIDGVRRLHLTESGYGFPLQVWIQAWAHGLTVKEVPVSLIYLEGRDNFIPELKDPVVRYRYYMDVISRELAKELERCSTFLP